MTRPKIFIAAAGVVCALVVGVAVLGMSDRKDTTSFAVLGDSYAVGYGAAKGNGWVEQLASNMCWVLTGRSAQGGTGYTNAGQNPSYAAYAQRVSAVTDGSPRVILVEGGTNDEQASPEQITKSATEVFRSIKVQVPDETVIVAIGPILTPKKNATSLARVSAALSRSARAVGVRYIDPVAEHWVDGDAMFFDAYHPNDDGYQDFARRLASDLQRMGIVGNC